MCQKDLLYVISSITLSQWPVIINSFLICLRILVKTKPSSISSVSLNAQTRTSRLFESLYADCRKDRQTYEKAQVGQKERQI